MTLEYRIDLIFDILNIDALVSDEADVESIKDIIRTALKEQDKITRHACAEAVISNTSVYEISNGDDAISPNEAHSVVINCRGGVE